MVQAFRREQNTQAAKEVLLRGLDATANYEVTNPDAGAAAIISGKDLMQKGLQIEITAQPGAAIIFYKKPVSIEAALRTVKFWSARKPVARRR